MQKNRARPLSPHLSIWRWGPHMAMSIANRVTGGALSTVAAVVLVWWLVAAASGPEAYDSFRDLATSWFGVLVGFGLTVAMFTHTAGGLRHYVLDIGAGYELRTNKNWAWVSLFAPTAVAVLLWAYILLRNA